MSVAGGATYGAAKTANLIMVKVNFDNIPFDQYGDPVAKYAQPQFTVLTIVDGLMWVMSDVNTKVAAGLLQRGKTILNISIGKSSRLFITVLDRAALTRHPVLLIQ